MGLRIDMTETFIRSTDGVEQTFCVSTLRKLAEALPLSHMMLEELSGSFRSGPWDDGWTPELVSVERCGPHWQPQADLTDPLLICPEGWVMDGNHRLALHAAKGTLLIPVKRFESFAEMESAILL